MVIVMALVTYFTLIIGELAPKWIAIAKPEESACYIARIMILFCHGLQASRRFKHLVDKIVVEMLGIHMGGEQPVSEEEIRVLLQQGAQLGTIDKEEPGIINNVFQLNDLTAADSMTPRTQLDWIDLEDTEENIWNDISSSSHFRLPVGSDSLDDFKGLADVSKVLLDQKNNPGKSIKASVMDTVYKPLLIPETLILTRVLTFSKQKVSMRRW